ncbi:hypothetical protein [Spiroplasma sp. DGKH1]|uniref:hypothetical protein n=1 Tax=Spiroplasma sp. DGKH1 TaxID=3050074 RepID=UPI0034C6AF41
MEKVFLGDILIKNIFDSPNLVHWIDKNRLETGTFSLFLWMFVLAGIFLVTLLSSWIFIYYNCQYKRHQLVYAISKIIAIIFGFGMFIFGNVIWRILINVALDKQYYFSLLTFYSYIQLLITFAILANNRKLVHSLLYIIYGLPFIIVVPEIINNLLRLNSRRINWTFVLWTLAVMVVFALILQLCGWIARSDEKSNVFKFGYLLLITTLFEKLGRINTSPLMFNEIRFAHLLSEAISLGYGIAFIYFLYTSTMAILNKQKENEEQLNHLPSDLDNNLFGEISAQNILLVPNKDIKIFVNGWKEALNL